MHYTSADNCARGARTENPEYPLCLPAFQNILQPWYVHLACIRSRNSCAKLTDLFVHYARALCTVPTVLDTIRVVTWKFIVKRDAIYQCTVAPINTLCTPLYITILTAKQLISLLCALGVHFVTQLGCTVHWLYKCMVYYDHNTWHECSLQYKSWLNVVHYSRAHTEEGAPLWSVHSNHDGPQ